MGLITSPWARSTTQIDNFDRAGLIGLIQSLYAASKENQIFLHARLGLSDYGWSLTRKYFSAGFGPMP